MKEDLLNKFYRMDYCTCIKEFACHLCCDKVNECFIFIPVKNDTNHWIKKKLKLLILSLLSNKRKIMKKKNLLFSEHNVKSCYLFINFKILHIMILQNTELIRLEFTLI